MQFSGRTQKWGLTEKNPVSPHFHSSGVNVGSSTTPGPFSLGAVSAVVALGAVVAFVAFVGFAAFLDDLSRFFCAEFVIELHFLLPQHGLGVGREPIEPAMGLDAMNFSASHAA